MTEVVPQLHQTATWTTAKGVTIPIEEMDKHHLDNTIRWLDRHAAQLKVTYELRLAFSGSQLTGDIAVERLEMLLDELAEEEPDAWLHATPLYRRMLEVQEARAA